MTTRRIRALVAGSAGGLAVVVLMTLALGDVITVNGASMEHAFRSGDRLAVLRADLLTTFPGLRGRLLAKGRVIVFRSPLNAGHVLIKRLVATEGDVVKIDGDVLFVNGRAVRAYGTVIPSGVSWPAGRDGQPAQAFVVPPNSYFVLSDNRIQGFDSRSLGALPRSAVVAVVMAPIWRRGATDGAAFARR